MSDSSVVFKPTEEDEAQMVRILAALKRARLRAEEVARATGTQLVQWENGKIVYVDPPKRPPIA
jgi:transcriptional regulator with XRE-family HTH domain